MTHWRRTAVFW